MSLDFFFTTGDSNEKGNEFFDSRGSRGKDFDLRRTRVDEVI